MRKMNSILTGILIAVLFMLSGCNKEIEDPIPCYTLKVKGADGTKILSPPYVVEAKQEIEFDNCGAADYYAYFSGKPESVWTDFQDPNDHTTSGSDTNPYGGFFITYPTPGTYIVTVVLTNREVKNPSNFKQVTIDFEIVVVAPAGK